MALLRSIFDQSGSSNRLLVMGLFALTIVLSLASIPGLLSWLPGVDLEIPLRATRRWLDGGQPYLASAFTVKEGADLPFLYPPWLLPILGPLTLLPRVVVVAPWLLLSALASVWTCRRLSIPWLLVPAALIWPPFAEGLITGNVQLLQLAAFVALFYAAGPDWALTRRDTEHERGRANDLRAALLAAGTGALKYTQLLTLVWLVRPRFRAAVIGGAILVAIPVLLLPFTGVSLYFDWVAQLGRAADPNWSDAGGPLTFLVGRPLGTAAAVAAVVGVLFVRGRDAGAWVGIALVVAAPSVHGYGLLLLLPALLTIRRDAALLSALMLSSYRIDALWVGVALCAGILALSNRFPALRFQPATRPAETAAEPGREDNAHRQAVALD